MKCLTCTKLSFSLICKKCQKVFLKPKIKKRVLSSGLEVYSFYRYSDIESLLKSKYQIYGSTIYKILAQNSFKAFAKNFEYPKELFALPIDDNVNKNFSHSAILAKSLKSDSITPLFSKLRARNQIKYAGKTKTFREQNPRDFKYSGEIGIEVILVDDIVTYGTTLNEAKRVLNRYNVNVAFALTLANTID